MQEGKDMVGVICWRDVGSNYCKKSCNKSGFELIFYEFRWNIKTLRLSPEISQAETSKILMKYSG